MEKAKLYRVQKEAAGFGHPRQVMKGRNRVR